MPIDERSTMAPDAESHEHRAHVLPDGRRIGYALYGDPAGTPLLFFHGTPGSRLLARFLDKPARARGIRVVAPDRPGYGLSTRHPGATLLDGPIDVEALADALGIQRFALLGVSGGGPHALALAWKRPKRVTRLGLASSVGPVAEGAVWEGLSDGYRLNYRVHREASWLVRLFATGADAALRTLPDGILERLLASGPRADRALWARADLREILLEDMTEGLEQGPEATARELATLAQPWGFDPAEITVPTVLWHGERDFNVPTLHGRFLAERIPKCRSTFVPDVGHLWFLAHPEALLDALAPPKKSKRTTK
ncbi:MAG: alpha/beta hydrolase [Myxococcales bacterium]|nr:alpha/beta hydrolase [Myxococcales bacterium]